MYLVYQEQKFRQNIYTRKISNSNIIRFTKLKQFLNTCSDDDIKDLITFLFQELKKRSDKNENKKKR